MTFDGDIDALARKVDRIEQSSRNDLIIDVRAMLTDWDVQTAYKCLNRARHASMELATETGNASLEEAERKISEAIPQLEKELHDALWNAFHTRVICQLLTEATNQ